MPTKKQETGSIGEDLVIKKCSCPKCKRERTLRRLPTNFKCADIICDFCGYLAQVKTTNRKNVGDIPDEVLGAAWEPQQRRMESSIYFPLFLVITNGRQKSIHYLSADLQDRSIFIPRKKLSENAKRAGWQGFTYDLSKIKDRFVRLF